MMMVMVMVMVTMMVNVCDDDYYLVIKVTLVKEAMSCDVSPVAMFENAMIRGPQKQCPCLACKHTNTQVCFDIGLMGSVKKI